MQEVLNNQGENQLTDVYDSYIDAAERSLEDVMDAALYGDGSLNGGKQLTGLATAIRSSTTAACMAALIARRQRTRCGERRI